MSTKEETKAAEKKPDLPKAVEQLQCAGANLTNLCQNVPGLKHHPFLKIVKLQLEECATSLGVKLYE